MYRDRRMIKLTQTVFQRVEKKYLLTEKQYHQVMAALKPYMNIDEYGLHTIGNVYYDTKEDTLIRNSIEKPPYKEKLRLRSYGIPRLSDSVFLEIKKKVQGIVNKRRIALPLIEAYRYLETGELSYPRTQIHNEMDDFLTRYELIPKLYLAYDRIALYGKEDFEFRVTFDQNIRSRTSDLYLESGDWGELLLENRERIMEVKILGAMPLWFVHILSKFEIYSSSFSKYGSVYTKQQQIQQRKKYIVA